MTLLIGIMIGLAAGLVLGLIFRSKPKKNQCLCHLISGQRCQYDWLHLGPHRTEILTPSGDHQNFYSWVAPHNTLYDVGFFPNKAVNK